MAAPIDLRQSAEVAAEAPTSASAPKRRRKLLRASVGAAVLFVATFRAGPQIRALVGYAFPRLANGPGVAARPQRRQAVSSRAASAPRPAVVGSTVSTISTARGASAVGAAAVAAAAAGKGEFTAENQERLKGLAATVVAALLFCAFVFVSQGATAGEEWLSCYVIEYSLSIDNLFVFILIFDYFKVGEERQSNVLFYGFAGAVLFRFLFVYLGAELLERFNSLILVFSAILLYASYKGITEGQEEDEEDLDNNFIIKNLKTVLDVTDDFDGEKFFVERNGKNLATPLFVCLLAIEFSDIVFATDSVPAVLSVTKSSFVAYTSNLFALIGLRSLYFILKEAMTDFVYLKPAVDIVLGFIGSKILVEYFDLAHVPTAASLFVVVGLLGGGIALSVLAKQENEVDGQECG